MLNGFRLVLLSKFLFLAFGQKQFNDGYHARVGINASRDSSKELVIVIILPALMAKLHHASIRRYWDSSRSVC
jgi:hypothetical protein